MLQSIDILFGVYHDDDGDGPTGDIPKDEQVQNVESIKIDY